MYHTAAEFGDPFLTEHVESVKICLDEDDAIDAASVKIEDFSGERFVFRVFKLDRQGAALEEIGE